MNKYELMYIVRPDLDEAGKEAVVERFSESIKSLGGEIESVNKWGTRKLAYPINFKKEGFYVLVNFSSNVDLPTEIERQMRISDDIMRFMIIKKG